MSDKIWDLCREKDYLVFEASKFLDEHTAADGTLSAKDAAEYERMEWQIQNVKDNIDRHERLQRSASYGGGQSTRPILVQPGANPFSGDYSIRQSGGIIGDEYHRNFIQAFRENFKDARNYLREGELSDGGWLCPTSFNDEIVTKLQEENVLRQISKVITTESTHRVPFVATQPSANWVGEGDEIEISSASFSTVTLEAHKLATCLLVTSELIQDSFYDLENFLTDELGRAFARAEEESFLNGDGTNNQPLGLLPTLAQSATSILQTTGGQITADDLITLTYSVDRPYRRSAKFLMSDSPLAHVRRIKDADQRYIWEPNYAGEEPPKILGYPVHTSNFMPPATSGNICVIFGDFSAVTIAERGNRQVRPLREKFALSDKVAFLSLERVDCALTDRHALRGLKIRQG